LARSFGIAGAGSLIATELQRWSIAAVVRA
jgi:hypothetical protein